LLSDLRAPYVFRRSFRRAMRHRKRTWHRPCGIGWHKRVKAINRVVQQKFDLGPQMTKSCINYVKRCVLTLVTAVTNVKTMRAGRNGGHAVSVNMTGCLSVSKEEPRRLLATSTIYVEY